jgi:large subunit ribosomal protein L17
MRHGKKFNHLSRTASHRKAMLSNMASSLIQHKRISTTVAKAKALRKYVEPLITKAKTDSTHSRRVVFSYLQDKDSVSTLFGEVAEKVADRPGGYTRIIKTGNRLGDNADMCIIELVDYNELLLQEAAPAKKTTRRSRRGGKKKSTEATTAVVEEAVVEETVEAVAEETTEEVAEETTEEAAPEADEASSEDEREKKDGE